MEPRIETLEEKIIIGKRLSMTFSEDKTPELWRGFMPRRNEIQNAIGSDLFSINIYPLHFFNPFDPNKSFEKWAAIEVTNTNSIPTDMESIILPEGLYAIFTHKGLSTDKTIFQYIFTEWLPQSNFALDHRPHFEILGKKYKNNDSNSEEKIWIPVKLKERTN